MRTQSTEQKGSASRYNKKLAACAGLILLLPLAAWAGGTVTNCTEADFLAAAVSGGTVTFACDGTITLSQTFTNNLDTVLDGTGHNATFSGGQSVGVFRVGPGIHFAVMNLVIADGRSTNGGAIYNDGGTVDLVGDVLTGNIATNIGYARAFSYGGPTLTMALLSGSPAIDAGNTAIAPMVDQRGFPRPAGAAADIGAFEYGSVMPSLAIAPSVGTSLQIIASGNAGAACRLLVSQDLSRWSVLATSQIGAGRTVLFQTTCRPGAAAFIDS